MEDKQDYAINGHKGDKFYSSGLLVSDAYKQMLNNITNIPPRFVIKEDKLKNITEKEIYVMAILEMLENKLWIEGSKIQILGKDEVMISDTNGKTIDDVIAKWKENINFTQTNEHWKDGRHEGDCTKVPVTCERCYCETHLEVARKFIKWFNNGEYQNY